MRAANLRSGLPILGANCMLFLRAINRFFVKSGLQSTSRPRNCSVWGKNNLFETSFGVFGAAERLALSSGLEGELLAGIPARDFGSIDLRRCEHVSNIPRTQMNDQLTLCPPLGT